jgi:8-oxo-dGTP pyrophosphatase MutT (NUDIX family)
MNAMQSEITGADAPERAQVGALCWRWHGGGVQVLLITSRETGRWVIPKGGIMAGHDAAGSARVEAWEEAGVEGKVSSSLELGCFDYDKLNRKRQSARRCRVSVFALKVVRLAHDYPERGERRRKWFSADKAAQHVEEPALRGLLAALSHDPAPLTAAAT